MTTPTFTPTDIVNFAARKDAVNLSTAFDQLVGQKIVDAIDDRKKHVASVMFNDSIQDEEDATGDEEYTEQETEESDEDAQVPN